MPKIEFDTAHYTLDIVIPVYNEGENISAVLKGIQQSVSTPCRILIGYDQDDDDTLPVASRFKDSLNIEFVKNLGLGPHGAVTTCFNYSDASSVIVLPGDDAYNIPILDEMVEKFQAGCEVVVASRFMPGGCMEGCPILKSFLVRSASYSLFLMSSIPVRDASNGFRLFSRKILDSVLIESDEGFTYSLELLVKCHRLDWEIGEVPASWFEREKGQSRFKVLRWLPGYLRWYFYGLSTSWLGRSKKTVEMKNCKT
ncbi:glycosyltransferase family 2 protein [Porticoccaceae bacterium]|jgi:dolichol-phosphate mannosyltransferase|nr:glycosyltransferase family 2 protein [Porticoccaceae bacterium]